MALIFPDIDVSSPEAVIKSCLMEKAFPGYVKYTGLYSHLTDRNLYRLRTRISTTDTIVLQNENHYDLFHELFPENKIEIFRCNVKVGDFNEFAQKDFDALQKLALPETCDKICTICGTNPIIDKRYSIFRKTKYQII